MQAEIKKWGNSLGVRLPRHITDSASLRDGTPVELTVEEDGTVCLRPTRKKFRLADLLRGHAKSSEVDWGGPKGEESW